jgi:uncharacterized membrane protein
MRRFPAASFRPRQPELVLVCCILSVALAVFDGPLVLRVPIGLVAGLLLPGYCLSRVLFPSDHDLTKTERISLSVAISIGTLVILALLLQYSPLGFTASALVLSLNGITLLANLAWLTRQPTSPETLPSVSAPDSDPNASRGTGGSGAGIDAAGGGAAVAALPGVSHGDRQTTRRVTRLATATLVATIGLVAAGVTLIVTRPVHTTEFYLLTSTGYADEYPRTATPGEHLDFVLGITNREGRPMAYRVEVRGPAESTGLPNALSLDDGASLETPITLTMAELGHDRQIDVLLFRDDDTVPYRTLRLWLDVQESAGSS